MTRRVRVVADAAIVGVQSLLGSTADVICVDGRELTRARLLETAAEALLVRSVTRIDRELLAETEVRFVASATAGVDHVDQTWLRHRGIHFAYAPGCNAPAVVHWVIAAMLWAAHAGTWTFAGPVGVVGFGNIGRRLVAVLEALGIDCLVCDPPLQDAGSQERSWASLDTILRTCPIVSLHVPLTHAPTSSHPTAGMIHGECGYRGCLINTSRGPVCTPSFLAQAAPQSLIVDVWPQEPELPWSLLARPDGPVWLASPHVAGYSRESKARATAMVVESLRTCFSSRIERSTAPVLPSPVHLGPQEFSSASHPIDVCAMILGATCALAHDDARVRGLAQLPRAQRATAFEALRRNYDLRRQPDSYVLGPELQRQLRPWAQRSLVAGGPALATALEIFGFTYV